MYQIFDDYGLAADADFKKGLQKQGLTEAREKSGIPLLFENDHFYADTADSHTLIFGNTGSKKTRNFCIPSVYSLGMAGESMIISDPKGEIYANTSGFLEKQGYTIQTINLREPEFGSTWNPLYLPYYYYTHGMRDKAVELVSDFATQLRNIHYSEKDPYWIFMAADLMIGLILMVFECAENEKQVHMASVQNIRMYIECIADNRNSGNSENSIFWDLVETFPQDSVIRYKLAGIVALKAVERTLGCVLSQFDAMMDIFLFNEKLMSMLSYSEINYSRIASEKTALFLIIPDEKQTFHFLISVFVKQCYEALIADAQGYPGHILPNRVNFILDEFSNFPKIQDMPSMISAARSRNIRFLLIVQSKQQLISLYGDEAETIKSNCRNWIFLTCRELSLLEEIQQLCGNIYVPERGYRPVLSIVDLQNLTIGWEDSQALILRPQCKPYISWVKDFSCYPQAGNPPVPFVRKTLLKAATFHVPTYIYRKLKDTMDNNTLESLDDLFS